MIRVTTIWRYGKVLLTSLRLPSLGMDQGEKYTNRYRTFTFRRLPFNNE